MKGFCFANAVARRPVPAARGAAQVNSGSGCSAPRSNAQIDLSDVIVMGESIAGAFARDAAMLQEIDARGDAERRQGVLFDQQNGRPRLLDLANGFENLQLEAVRDADRWLVEQQ